MATIDSRLIALDRNNGKLLWDRSLSSTGVENQGSLKALLSVTELTGAKQTGQSGYSASLAPQVFKNRVFVGITGAVFSLP